MNGLFLIHSEGRAGLIPDNGMGWEVRGKEESRIPRASVVSPACVSGMLAEVRKTAGAGFGKKVRQKPQFDLDEPLMSWWRQRPGLWCWGLRRERAELLTVLGEPPQGAAKEPVPRAEQAFPAPRAPGGRTRA